MLNSYKKMATDKVRIIREGYRCFLDVAESLGCDPVGLKT